MKNPARVAELLAELRELADTDFERHRLDVLERDLTSPPVVEVVDDKHQQFNGMIFPKIKSGHYSNHSFPIHRAVWTYFNGELPKGYEIHHIDNNPANNNIQNLIALSEREHKQLHWKNPREKKYICQHCGEIFISTSPHHAKYCSIKCRNQAKNEQWKKRNTEIRNCIICGKSFSTIKYTKTKTCSPTCAGYLAARTKEANANK